MYKRRHHPKAFQLRFQGTAARKYAPTMRQAMADARYWLSFGQTKVCIFRRSPNLINSYSQVRCLKRRR